MWKSLHYRHCNHLFTHFWSLESTWKQSWWWMEGDWRKLLFSHPASIEHSFLTWATSLSWNINLNICRPMSLKIKWCLSRGGEKKSAVVLSETPWTCCLKILDPIALRTVCVFYTTVLLWIYLKINEICIMSTAGKSVGGPERLWTTNTLLSSEKKKIR